MAENEDKSQKTEEPTQKKLEDARKKGQVANSREVNHWFMILAGTLAVVIMAPTTMSDLARGLSRYLEYADAIPADAASIRRLGANVVGDAAGAMFPIFALFVCAALATGLLQHGPVASVEKIKPKLENISLVKGLSRLFSLRSLVEFVKGIAKLAVVATVATLLVLPEMDVIRSASALDPTAVLDLLWMLAARMLGGICAVVTVIAGLDLLYQRFEFHKSMRMSKHDIKEEIKQSEGDPIVKARLRQLRLDRARKRMMAAVPDADVVIANPTHFAVALKYDSATMAAPTLVAKGVDAVALRIREVAEDNDVTVVENPPLARALWETGEIDKEISETQYKAVAEVIGYVWRLKRKAAPGRRR